jgi:hypothetical protein
VSEAETTVAPAGTIDAMSKRRSARLGLALRSAVVPANMAVPEPLETPPVLLRYNVLSATGVSTATSAHAPEQTSRDNATNERGLVMGLPR